MSAEELDALRSLNFDWTSGLKDVWVPSRYHIEGLHIEAAELVRQGIGEAQALEHRAESAWRRDSRRGRIRQDASARLGPGAGPGS